MKTRKLIQTVHLWLALIFCLPLVLMGLTGSVMVITNNFGKEHYTVTAGEPKTAGDIIKAASKNIPKEFTPNFLKMPNNEDGTARVRFSAMQPPGEPPKNKQIVIDPVSLEILDDNPSLNPVLKTIRLLHTNALINSPIGRNISGIIGSIMLFMAISGVVLWWPRTIHRLKASFTIKLKGNKFRINRDTHGAIGIWGLLVFVIVSFSGVYLAFPKAMSSGITAVFPGRDIKDNSIKVAEIKSAKPINIDKAISIALSAHPDLKVISANLSTKPDQPYRINLAQHDYEDRQPLTTLFINPWNSEIIETRNPELYTTGETIIAWQLSLHSGDGIGAPWKVLIFLNGFLPLMFTITGITMWLIKRKARKAD